LRYHIEGKLFEYLVISDSVGLRKHLPVDGAAAKSEMERFLFVCDCKIREVPQAFTSVKLSENKDQKVIPMRHTPVSGPVVVFGNNSIKLLLRQKESDLREYELSDMHVFAELEFDAKIQKFKLRTCFLIFKTLFLS
jgi:hypothetical protein